MIINFTNTTSNKSVKIHYRDNSITLLNNESYRFFDERNEDFVFKIELPKHNSVFLNPLSVLSGFVFDDNVICTIYCDAEFKIVNDNTNDIINIEISDIDARYKKQYIYESVFCKSCKDISQNYVIKKQ